MTYEQNVKAILESNFAGFKEEIIDTACKHICMLETKEESIDRVLEIIDKHINRYEKGKKESHDMTGVYSMCKAVAVDIKSDVLALRGSKE